MVVVAGYAREKQCGHAEEMTITGDKVIFETTGREIYAYQGVIGLNQYFQIISGYEERFDGFDEYWEEYLKAYDKSYFTKQENIELAEFMIARWQEFRKRVEAEVQFT